MSDKKKRAYNFKEIVPRKALYFYTCQSCGKKRNTRIYKRAIGKICQKCLKNKIPDNQPDLFGNLQSAIGTAGDGLTTAVDMGEGESQTVRQDLSFKDIEDLADSITIKK